MAVVVDRRAALLGMMAAPVAAALPVQILGKPTSAALDNTVLWQPVEGPSIWFVSWGKETIKLWEGMKQ